MRSATKSFIRQKNYNSILKIKVNQVKLGHAFSLESCYWLGQRSKVVLKWHLASFTLI